MKLIACPECHAQYDVSTMGSGERFDCRCGASLEATAPKGVEAVVQRCSACGALAKDGDDQCAYCGSAIVPIGHQGSLICPECYARNGDDARFCLACGVAFDPEPTPKDAPELRCPCCECWMSPRRVGGIHIEECPKCHGLWAAESRFDLLVQRAAQAARERAAGADSVAPRVEGANPAAGRIEYRRCPVCDALMARRNFRRRSGVVIDRCHAHGTWLDAHELEQIAGFVLSGRAAQAARLESEQEALRERRAAREAMRRLRSGSVVGAGPSTPFDLSGAVRGRSKVGTIVDLLQRLLN